MIDLGGDNSLVSVPRGYCHELGVLNVVMKTSSGVIDCVVMK